MQIDYIYTYRYNDEYRTNETDHSLSPLTSKPIIQIAAVKIRCNTSDFWAFSNPVVMGSDGICKCSTTIN